MPLNVAGLNDINKEEEKIELLEVEEKPKSDLDLESVDARLMTIDDFLNDND